MDRPQANVPKVAQRVPAERAHRPLPLVVAPSRAAQHGMLRPLKGVAVVATVLAAGAFGGLVGLHPVGAASAVGAARSGITADGAAPGVASITAADPFFDTGAQGVPQPIFRSNGRTASIQSGGS